MTDEIMIRAYMAELSDKLDKELRALGYGFYIQVVPRGMDKDGHYVTNIPLDRLPAIVEDCLNNIKNKTDRKASWS